MTKDKNVKKHPEEFAHKQDVAAHDTKVKVIQEKKEAVKVMKVAK